MSTPRPLSGDQLSDLLRLTKEADSVELKASVPDSSQRSAVRALGLDPLVAQVRQVYFFDTPDLRLDASGLIVRARRVAGEVPIRKLFSKRQRALFAELAPDDVTLDDLSILGPIFVLKFKWPPEGYDRKLVVELWLYPDDYRILELSTKCAPGEAFQVAAETRAFLAARGVDLHAEQAPKTRRALDFFSQRLLEASPA